MGFFGKKNKKEENACHGCGTANAKPESAAGASIQILGSGCAKCNQLEAAVKAALEQLGLDMAIDHITDFAQIAAYGVMTTPALVVGGRVVSSGRVLKVDEIIPILQKNQ